MNKNYCNMDYEKKYKEALERAKGLLEGMDEGDYFASNEDIENIFPELKPSEDEQIKKDIISYLRNEKIVKRYISDIEVDKWIAWLEKQGETFNADITNRSDEMLHAISTGLTDVGVELGWSDFGGIPIEEIKDWLEKQGEQTHAKLGQSEVTKTSDQESPDKVEPKDAHPDIDVRTMAAWQSGYKEAIDKACEWLDYHLTFNVAEWDEGVTTQRVIDKFRKAMKGGEE